MPMEKLWIVVWENSKIMFVHFTICNSIHDLLTMIRSSIENNVVSIFMGFQNANKNVFHGFGNVVTWIWKSFGNVLRVVCMNPVY